MGKEANTKEIGLHLTVKQALEKLGTPSKELKEIELCQRAVEKQGYNPIRIEKQLYFPS